MKVQCVALILTVFITSFPAHGLLECKQGDTEAVAMANDLYLTMDRLFKSNVVRRDEVQRAKLFLYEAQFCSAHIDLQRFCGLALPLLRNLTVQTNGRKDTLPPEQRRENITLLAQTKKLCEK